MNRNKQGALEVLLETTQVVRPKTEDPIARELLTPELVAAVLDVAWEHQFDDDRSACLGETRQVLTDAVEARFLKEAQK